MIERVTIVGAGPAGTSLAIRLATSGLSVTLVERETFPREKLCGEFISPECFEHFRALGVASEMLAAGGEQINETVFYARSGRSVSIPTTWFGGANAALGLSRAAMDLRLLQRAKEAGVDVHEGSIAKALRIQNGVVRGINVAGVGARAVSGVDADLVIDATGRARVLSKLLSRAGGPSRIAQHQSSSLIAFKAHFRGVDIDHGRCNIFSFPGGYGGLSNIESGLANLCFLVRTAEARRVGSKPDRILSELICRNPSARKSLRNAVRDKEWLSASIRSFGTNELTPTPGLLSVGDAAAFNDPFTGSGMLMAFEGAQALGDCIIESRLEPEKLAERYSVRFHNKFDRRLRISGALRRLAFVPALAEAAVVLLGFNRSFAKSVARATRRHSPAPGAGP